MVELEVNDGVAWLTLNRPKSLNALDLVSVRELSAHLEQLREMEEARVVVTQGAGGAFCAGSDLKDLAPLSAEEATAAEVEHGEACALLEMLPQPTLAMMHGYVIGGGVGLALYHDFRIAARSATFQMPEVKLGWTPPWGMGRLVDLVGGANARWLAMGCVRLGAPEAREIGLVNEVIGEEEFEQWVRDFASRLAGFPPEALRRTKSLINEMTPLRDRKWEKAAAEAFEQCYGSREARENVAAFMSRKGG